jgi:type IX secretion system PorP/SprF family membrane protein
MKVLKLSVVFAALLAATGAQAQQLPLYSQYMHNDLVLNPAVAGTKDFAPFRSIIRSQWDGIEGNPNTQTLSFHNSIKDKKMGFGISVFNDRLGPVGQAGISGTYSYRLEFSEKSKLSFGLSGQIYRYRIDVNELRFNNTTNTDKALMANGDYRSWHPNFSFGTLYYSENYWAGLSIPELLENRVGSSRDAFILKKKRHYYLTGGYRYKIDETYTIEPSMVVKYVANAPMQLDLNARLHAFDKFSLGVSYRTNAAVVLLIGFKFKEQWHFGYSYDITTTPLKNYTVGSHEIMIGYDLIKTKSASKI